MLALLTLIIAVTNLCLGFVLAVKLGLGPPTVRDGWQTIVWGGQAGVPSAGQPASEPAGEDLSADLAAMLQEDSPAELDAMLAEDTLEDLFREALEDEPQAAEPVKKEETAPTPAESDAPAIWDLNEKYVETSILRLNIAMMKSGARATEIDTRLRAVRGKSDAETIQSCLASLREDCQTYLKEQSEAAEKLHARIDELGELAALGEEIEMANMEQAAQIETTLNNLATMDFTSDLEAANTRLLEELGRLRAARHRLRDSQDEAFLAVARYEGRTEKIEPQLYNDPLTKLFNCIGLETTLFQWWKAGHPKNRQMSAVLVDLDGFNRVNEAHGSLVGDKILFQIARILQNEAGTGDLVGRMAGQRFLWVPVDIGPRTAVKKVELLRQKIEKTTFVHGAAEIRLSLGGAVTEVKPEDTIEGLFQRLQETLKAAKKAGPNVSFLHDGRSLERIESPNLGADYVEVRI